MFYHEHVLTKEAGTFKTTPWHHDQAYYPIDGFKVLHSCLRWGKHNKAITFDLLFVLFCSIHIKELFDLDASWSCSHGDNNSIYSRVSQMGKMVLSQEVCHDLELRGVQGRRHRKSVWRCPWHWQQPWPVRHTAVGSAGTAIWFSTNEPI